MVRPRPPGPWAPGRGGPGEAGGGSAPVGAGPSGPSRPTRRGPGYGALFSNGNYVRVFSAGLGSVAGSAIALVSFTWLVASTTGSALDVAYLGAAGIVASIAFSVFGGTLVDRYDARRLMIVSDLSRAAAMTVAVLDLWWLGFDLRVLVGVYAAVGAFGTLFNPAENALVPRLVPTEAVAHANGLVRSSRSALQFAGAGIGGALIVLVGPLWGIVANAATFVLSAALLTGVRTPGPSPSARPRATGGRSRYWTEVAAGFRWLARSAGFLQLTLSATVFNFCSTLVGTFLVFYATELLHGSAGTFALLLAVEVAGSGIGGLLVGPTRAVRWAGKAWVVPYGVVSGGCALSLALVPVPAVAFSALFALGVLAGFSGTAWLSAAQSLVPPEMLGRYFGIDNLGSVAIVPAAQLGGALLIGRFGLGPTYTAVAALWLVAGLVFLVPRALWTLGTGPNGPSNRRSAGGEAGRSGSPAESRDG